MTTESSAGSGSAAFDTSSITSWTFLQPSPHVQKYTPPEPRRTSATREISSTDSCSESHTIKHTKCRAATLRFEMTRELSTSSNKRSRSEVSSLPSCSIRESSSQAREPSRRSRSSRPFPRWAKTSRRPHIGRESRSRLPPVPSRQADNRRPRCNIQRPKG